MTELVQQIFTDALFYTEALYAGGTPSDDDNALMLRIANRLLDSWSAEKLSLAGLLYKTYPLTGAGSYGLGAGGLTGSTRPIKIKTASVIAANGLEKEITIVMSEQWAGIPDKTRTGIFAENGVVDNGIALVTLQLTPKPVTGGSLALWTYEAFTNFAALTDNVVLPVGYNRPLVLALAAEFCIPFGKPLRADLAAQAQQAKHAIASLTAEILGLSPPVPATSAASQTVAPGAAASE